MPLTCRPRLSHPLATCLLVCIAARGSADTDCRRGLGIDQPFISEVRSSPVFGDVDGDGRLDTVAKDWQERLFVLLNRGAVHVRGESFLYTQEFERLLAVHDQNGDGHADFVFSRGVSKRVVFGNGDGSFGESVETTVSQRVPNSELTTDFDGDGRLDFIEFNDETFRLLKGTSEGGFVESGVYPATRPHDTRDPFLGDFDGDGLLDIATISGDLHTTAARIYWGNGTFAFTMTGAGARRAVTDTRAS